MTYTSELEVDDALGLALRAFVEQSLAKGADGRSIIYLIIATTVRTAFDLTPNNRDALAAIHEATSHVASVWASTHSPPPYPIDA